jgi:transposase-like protein
MLNVYAPGGNVRCPQCFCATTLVKAGGSDQDEADIWLCAVCAYPFVTRRNK